MERNYALDYARAIMLIIGIPYHIFCMYQLGGGWLLDSGQPSFMASVFSNMSHSFRMYGFFMLSGFFAGMILARRNQWTWLKDRTFRVLIPAVCTTLTIGFFCQYVIFLSNFGSRSEALEKTLDIFPRDADFHVWFLNTLFLFCVFVSVFFKPVSRVLEWTMDFVSELYVGDPW
ncbi:acyltransferase family protein [Mangrovicoccus ximenensis]|uniref:acyltransferase family protein n=1 Tax=Mangrovicoccus ximenensis TaxID=1911570 RepID=UPI0011AE4EED|nr:acyltransferase family protein [Mangrovicoccus ximenensis]